MSFTAALPTIGLDEIVETASLQTRIDRKYVLRLDDVEKIFHGIDPATRVLSAKGNTRQKYQSCYFDTPTYTFFTMAAHGRRKKVKVRTRTYCDTQESFLELKQTGLRDETIKDRIGIPYAQAQSNYLNSQARNWLAYSFAEAGQSPEIINQLLPILESSYSRTTLLLPGDQCRATIDTDLRWSTDDRILKRPSMAIVETKSLAQPSLIDRMLWTSGYRPAKISKFGTGLAALNPSLPRNKWTRVLKQFF